MRTLLAGSLLAAAVALGAAGCASGGKPPAAAAKPEPVVAIAMERSEYLLGVGDSIEVSVYKQPQLAVSEKINLFGVVMFPMIGDVEVKGKGVRALRDELTRRYSRYFVKPEVLVRITAVGSQKFMVLGEVKNPGLFTLDNSYTVAEALAKAGGVNYDAKSTALVVRRGAGGENEVTPVAIGGNEQGLGVAQGQFLQNGDIVYVPQKGLSVTARFMDYIGRIVNPVVLLEEAFVLWPRLIDALSGTSADQGNVIVGQ